MDHIETNVRDAPVPAELPALDWTRVCGLEEIATGSGVCARVGAVQIAVFRISDDEIRAVQNACPHTGAPVLHQGIVGDHGGIPKVACPLHKRTFSLEDGHDLSSEGGKLRVYPVRVAGGSIWVGNR